MKATKEAVSQIRRVYEVSMVVFQRPWTEEERKLMDQFTPIDCTKILFDYIDELEAKLNKLSNSSAE